MKIRLLIADDHAIVKEAISFWLTNHAEVQVVGLAQNGRIAVDLTCQLQPDVVVMDMTMPCLNGIEAASEIVGRVPGTRVLILSDDIRSQSVRDAIEAGASGYLSKHCSPEELVQAIRQVFDEGMYLSTAGMDGGQDGSVKEGDMMVKWMAPLQESLRRQGSETPKTAETWSSAFENSAVAAQAKDVVDSRSVESVSYPVARSVANPPVWRESSSRVFDIIASIMILLVIWPFMLLLALLIRLTSCGPAVYRQQRVGRHHKVFTLYKFRTMVDGAERDTGPVWASAGDPRVTPVGRILRRTRMDELPQLVNVLRGDMSLVGPRPERPHFVARYKALQGVRLAVRPGITGLAQTRGDYDLRPQRKLRYDLLYLRNRSLLLNVYILARTVSVVLMRKGC